MVYSDESIVSAILTYKTNRAAAKALGMSERYLYDRLRTKRLQEKLQASREQAMQDAMRELQLGMVEAAATLREIVNDRDVLPQARISAATALLQNGLKLTEQLDILKRLEALEDAD